jgi:hypothetical protein
LGDINMGRIEEWLKNYNEKHKNERRSLPKMSIGAGLMMLVGSYVAPYLGLIAPFDLWMWGWFFILVGAGTYLVLLVLATILAIPLMVLDHFWTKRGQ